MAHFLKALLVSWDVVSMFPDIDNQLGLTAVKKALNARMLNATRLSCTARVY